MLPSSSSSPSSGRSNPTVRCQCGSVSFPAPLPRPLSLHHCHCTECQRQTGSAFGTSAVFPASGGDNDRHPASLFPLAPGLAARLGLYTRPVDGGGEMDCYFCLRCGSRLFHRDRGPDGVLGDKVIIKGGYIEGMDWTGGRHIFMRSAVIKIPAEWEQYDITIPGDEDPRCAPAVGDDVFG
ncbi:Mss4-like protein [Xylariaceae sp. FL0804]|nr:Mss4-like protein [Xylariaceae sp. FL0804]